MAEPCKKRKITASSPEPIEQVVIEQTMTIDVRDQWATIAQHAIVDYIHASPLKTISEHIKPDRYKGFTPFLVNEIIRLASPHHGIGLSLRTIIDSIDMVCKEACLLIGRQERFGEDYAKPRPITVYVEHLPFPSVTSLLEEQDQEQWLRVPLAIRQILMYDRDRQWLAMYRELGHTEINVLTVRIGDASHILSMLIPCCVLHYSWRMEKNDYLTSYEQLLHEHQTNLFQLHSMQRVAKNNAQITTAIRLDELNNLKREVARLNSATPSAEVVKQRQEQATIIEELLKQNASLQLALEDVRQIQENATKTKRRIESLERTNKKLKNTMLDHGLLKSKGHNKATVCTGGDLFASLRKAVRSKRALHAKRTNNYNDYDDDDDDDGEEEYDISLSM